MFGIVRSAFYAVVNSVVGGGFLKLVIMGVLALLASGAAALVQSLVPSITLSTSGLPVGVVWIMRILRFDVGVPLLLGAYVARFLIRRIPVFG
jgi:hypothetical protein